MSTTTGILFIDVDTVAGYSLFKEGMYVTMDEYWYSLKKQIDGLTLGKLRHSFHSFDLFIHTFFRSAAFWGISFLMFNESLGCWSITHPGGCPWWMWREAL